MSFYTKLLSRCYEDDQPLTNYESAANSANESFFEAPHFLIYFFVRQKLVATKK